MTLKYLFVGRDGSVKGFAASPDKLTAILEAHMLEEENKLL